MRRTTIVIVCVLGAALVVALPGTPARAAFASTNGLIAYVSDPTGASDILAVDPAGGGPVTLTETPDVRDLAPAWSPDGRHLAFTRTLRDGGKADLNLMNANGSARQRILQSSVAERDPSWSPDGTRIAYAARIGLDGSFRIFVAAADGTGAVQLTSHTEGDADRAPVWSPDGTKIAFASDRDGGFPEIYLMSADGSGQMRFTTNTSIDGNPSWSPDGTKLLVERCCGDGTSEIYAIDLATRAETDLTLSTEAQEFDPVWSPDGAKIAYVAFPAGGGNIDIWTMNADGSGQNRLTTAPEPDLAPSWQPVPVCTITGTDHADELVGTTGDDVICGMGGADTIHAGLGNDLVLGGAGNDALLEGQEGNDLIYGEQGNDVLDGGPGFDVLDGGPKVDACLAGLDGAITRECE